MVAIAACYVYRKQVRRGDRLPAWLGSLLPGGGRPEWLLGPHRRVKASGQPPGVRTASHRVGENDSKPRTGPEGGMLPQHQVTCSS